MVPQPEGHNPQRQSLTTALRKICRDYPAGAGVLKELLQNADDAGASTVKFILDTDTHPKSPVLAEGLSEYQGPALLAYNDALFSKQDFHSLTSLGDSKKVHEKAATGKFGLGFSSVFNWTDSPALVSGSTLLLLDPHHSWSKDFPDPGGPNYKFTRWANDQAMINQLECFSLVNTEWERDFHGTIIRLPLRNASQAPRSDISKTETTVDDVRNAIDTFASEMGSNGLLFLRSVRRIVLAVRGEHLGEIEVINQQDLNEPKMRFQSMLDNAMSYDGRAVGEVYHEVHLRHTIGGRGTVKKFGVLNLVVQSINDDSLQTWAASGKMFPWVAVAAPLQVSGSGIEAGRLFTTLPLPCSTGLSVHINGLFSITADRSRLHGLDDNGVQDHRPKEWNKILFGRLIPMAWAKLLSSICQNYPKEDHSHLWPTTDSDPQQLWHGICAAVVGQAFQNHLPVWFTEIGHVTLEDGLLASEESHWMAREAYAEAKIPVIFMSNHILEEARRLAGSRSLTPRTLYQSLEAVKIQDNLSSSSRLLLLDHLIGVIPFTELQHLPVFPFQDGNFRSLEQQPVFLHRDDLENTLFAQQEESTIDTDMLLAKTSKLMHEGVKKGERIVRYRNPEDLRDYYFQHIANESGDTIGLDEGRRTTLSRVWMWIVKYCNQKLPLAAIGPLWLVPLRGSRVRRLVPTDASNFVTWFPAGEVNDVAIKIFTSNDENEPKMLADDMSCGEIWGHLRTFAVMEQSLCIKAGNNFENLLEFLAQKGDTLQFIGEDAKISVLRVLKPLWWSSRSRPCSSRSRSLLQSLYLFKAVEWPIDASRGSLKRYWTSMTSGVSYKGLRKLLPVPSSPEQVFIDVTDDAERGLFEELGILECLDEMQVLEKIVIPAIRNGTYNNRVSSEFRLEVLRALFQSYYHMSGTTRGLLSNLAVVPLRQSRRGSLRFGCPWDTLDPEQTELRKLYFEDEIAFPEQRFYKDFAAILADCGMVNKLTDRVVLSRIRAYGRKDLEFGVVASRARQLLQSPLKFLPDNTLQAELTKEARNINWLPARSPNRSDSFTNSWKCRDSVCEPLVGHVWHVLPFKVENSWRSILGWQNAIDLDTLLSQLTASIKASDINSVEETLSYLGKHYSIEDYATRLLKLSFVRSSNGNLVRIDNVCRQGGEKLLPYLYTVDRRFWDANSELMKLSRIPGFPSLEQLQNVQNALMRKNPLDEEGLDVAVEMARIWGRRFPGSVGALKLPSDSGMLVNVVDLVFNDRPLLEDAPCAVVHPKVSRELAKELKVQTLSELLKNGDLGIEDSDDDVFIAREEVADGINDTLDRYTRESTFQEYLANADDCGSASRVNFLLDETKYGTKNLLCEDLQDLQGPSLLIHNDGVFTTADFEGLKRVGRGSKREDPTAIGKFGRGSQTMYHWCDVSMILSGDTLLILDPLQKHLPFSYRFRERKPGVLVKYAKFRTAFQKSDQLAPFEGLWGFDSSRDFYNGTIFRFPLRKEGQDSELLGSRQPADVATTQDVFRKKFDEARLALLFLRNLTTIDFSVKGRTDSEWRVSRGTWPQTSSFSDWADILVEHRNPLGIIESTTERWWRAIEDVEDPPTELQHRHKQTMKHVECGIAALIPQKEKRLKSGLEPLKSRFFNCLPLKFESNLPVHIHATFLLSGDRQNIATEKTSKEAGAEWNNWLLREKVPGVYFRFLEDIGRKIGQDVYEYFPTRLKQKPEVLSDLIRGSFWEKIKSSDCLLFPVIEISQAPADSTNKSRAHRKAPKLLSARHAIFDVLVKATSDALRPLLCKLMKDLVCPPTQVTAHIKPVPGGKPGAGDKPVSDIQVLTPTLVRELLRSPEARKHVEMSNRVDKNFLNILLSFIMPKTPADLAELDGCPVLLLANGDLGTLSLKSTDTGERKVETYYSANKECHDLFAPASSLFSAIGGHEKFTNEILNSGHFNLRSLVKGDISTVLLNSKESWPQAWASKAWAVRFWNYMNLTSHSGAEADIMDWGSLEHFPLLLLRQHCGKESFISLHHFQSQPIVVSSTIEQHMGLFAEFPDLGIVHASTLPKLIRQAEQSLFDLASINRFLKSIGMLADRDGKSLTEFVRAIMGEGSITALGEVILKVLTGPDVTTGLLPDNVKDLPLWPRLSKKEGYLTAREAMVAENSDFVVPWIKDYDRFTKANDLCKDVALGDAQMITQYVLPTLPGNIDGIKPIYIRLIRSIASSLSRKQTEAVADLSKCSLAASVDGKLCRASDLFDTDSGIFSAAFRAQSTIKFLMPDVRYLASFWCQLGIRRQKNGRLEGRDYLACLNALKLRLTGVDDPLLATDTKIVLRPLCTSDGSLSNLDRATWGAIAILDVFPVSSVSGKEPGYRRMRLSECSQRSTMKLREIVRREFAAVCWSQTSFALHEPSIYTLGQIGSKGQPSCAMVWRHLAFLADQAKLIQKADLESFIDDLDRTYEFLQVNLQESKRTFGQPQAAMWLNATTPRASSRDIFKSSWTTLESLLLDSPCDAPPLMIVQPFLGRFSTLLKEIGCKSVCYPSIVASNPNQPQTTLTLVQQMWQEGILVDVRFEVEGHTVPAHKLILASRSEYCKRQFHGAWAVGSGNNASTKVIKIEDMTYATFKILIDYCYISDLDWAISMRVKEDDSLDAIADKLDALLDVLTAADRWFMPDLHANAERNFVAGARYFIRPDNVEDVGRVAGGANSVVLKNYCAEYKVRNAEAVLLAS